MIFGPPKYPGPPRPAFLFAWRRPQEIRPDLPARLFSRPGYFARRPARGAGHRSPLPRRDTASTFPLAAAFSGRTW